MIGTKEDVLHWLISAEDKTYEVKEFKAKRSLDANAYYWALLSQMARILDTTTKELHSHFIEDYAPTLTVVTVRADVDLQSMNAGYYFPLRMSSDGKWQAWELKKGSRLMDHQEFSRVLDHAVEEAKLLDIDTMTKTELEMLKHYEKEHY